MLEAEKNADSNVIITDSPYKKQKLNDSQSFTEENENIVCTICSELWTTRGSHCLVSLKCGHLFGKSCITKWITVSIQKSGTKNASCPNCKKVAAAKDIRIVLPINIAAKDTTQQDEMKKELEQKKCMIRDYQQSIDLSHLSLNLMKKQLKRVQGEFDTLLDTAD